MTDRHTLKTDDPWNCGFTVRFARVNKRSQMTLLVQDIDCIALVIFPQNVSMNVKLLCLFLIAISCRCFPFFNCSLSWLLLYVHLRHPISFTLKCAVQAMYCLVYTVVLFLLVNFNIVQYSCLHLNYYFVLFLSMLLCFLLFLFRF